MIACAAKLVTRAAGDDDVGEDDGTVGLDLFLELEKDADDDAGADKRPVVLRVGVQIDCEDEKAE